MISDNFVPSVIVLYSQCDIDFMPDYFPPKLNEKAFNCPLCDVKSTQFWSNVFYDVKYSTYTDYYVIGNFRTSSCDNCKGRLLWFKDNIIFPDVNTVARPLKDTPDEAKEIYREAAKRYHTYRTALAHWLTYR